MMKYNVLVCVTQVLQHTAADATGVRRADRGGGAFGPAESFGARYGDLPADGPDQRVRGGAGRRPLRRPVRLEERARIQRAARLPGS